MRKIVILTWLLFAAAAAPAQDMPLSQVLMDGQDWKEAKLPKGTPEALAGAANGELFVAFSGAYAQLLVVGKGGGAVELARPSSRVNCLAFAASGDLYASLPQGPHVSAR